MIVGGVYPGLYGLSGLLAPPPPLPPESVTSCKVIVRYCGASTTLEVRDMSYSCGTFTELEVRSLVVATAIVVTQNAEMPCEFSTIEVEQRVTADLIDVAVRQLVTSTVVEGWKP